MVEQPGPTTHTLSTPEADLVYDVHGLLPPADGRPVLMMVGQPMGAAGFAHLAARFPERTVVAYDVRGIDRSTRKDGREDHTPQQNAADVHALIEAVGGGPVELLGSSGGAITALEVAVAHPGDVSVVVAHEPPILGVLPDAANAAEAMRRVVAAYQEGGFGRGMAAFAAVTSWQGELTQEFLDQPAPDPAAFGMPTEDDGSRSDPLLSGSSAAVTDYVPGVDALLAAPARIVVAVGEESAQQLPGRAATALAERLGQTATVFPSHHGGFMGGEYGYAGKPDEFAATLREVLEG